MHIYLIAVTGFLKRLLSLRKKKRILELIFFYKEIQCGTLRSPLSREWEGSFALSLGHFFQSLFLIIFRPNIFLLKPNLLTVSPMFVPKEELLCSC